MKTIYHTSVLRIAEISTRVVLALIICMIGLLAAPQTIKTAHAQSICISVTDVPMTECEALVTFYFSTNGAAWSDSTNWLSTTTVDDWYGVWVLNGHVDKLQLAWNNLSGTIPTQIVNLTNLVDLSINNNAITGTLPDELGSLTNLVFLNLNNNQFEGSIPSTLGNLSYLVNLNLRSNQLDGSIPPQLGNLSNLQSMDLSTNLLSGTIPSSLGNLANLTSLKLYVNLLTGSIPPELGNLSSLWTMELYNNLLTGSIPPELGSLSNLYSLYLYSNQLSGSIPPELGSLSILTYLFLDSNQLSGSIPPELGNLSNLYHLRLNGNPLTGSVPLTFTNLNNLYFFYFYDTFICEPDTTEFEEWKSTVASWSGTGIACVLNPLQEEKLTSSKVTFAWDPVTDAAKYKLQLSTQEDFSSLVFSTNVTAATYPYLTSLLFDKPYYWRFKSLVGSTWSDWTSYMFYSMDPLTAPTLFTPLDGALLYPEITLSWSTVENATQFKLQVARDSAFTDRVFNGKLTDTLQNLNDLAPGKYYWRVKAIEEGGLKGPWSEVRGFTVTKIFPPVLVSPDNEAVVKPNVPLSWNTVENAVKYKLQVSKDAAFTKLIVSEKTTDLSKALTGLSVRNYYWRVKSIDAEGFKSPWSEVRKFTVVP